MSLWPSGQQQTGPASHLSVAPGTPMSVNNSEQLMPKPELQNIVCTVNLGCKLDLKKISLHARIYRMVRPKIVLLVFVSGKVVLTGVKVRDEIYEAFHNIYPILRNF